MKKKKKKKNLFFEKKIERKFWKLSAPSQIVAGPLRLKHKFKKNLCPSFFFWKNKGFFVAPSIEFLPLKAY
jgi:hypothetical protein